MRGSLKHYGIQIVLIGESSHSAGWNRLHNTDLSCIRSAAIQLVNRFSPECPEKIAFPELNNADRIIISSCEFAYSFHFTASPINDLPNHTIR
jgi:hypothetical protein